MSYQNKRQRLATGTVPSKVTKQAIVENVSWRAGVGSHKTSLC